MGSAPVRITNLTEIANIINESTNRTEQSLIKISQEIRRMYDLLASPGEAIKDEYMEIPLKITKMVGTGTKLGKNTPFLFFLKDMVERVGYSWRNIEESTIDSDQGLTGWKVLKISSFQPGKTYEFSVNVDEDFTNIANDKHPISIFATKLSDVMFAIDATKTSYLADCISDGWFKDPSDYIPSLIGNLKASSWIARLPRGGGAFSVTPEMESLYIHIGVHLPWGDGHQGCIVTEFDSGTNSITIGGY